MDFDQMQRQLAHNARRIQALVTGVDEAQARWKPDAASWSILEVVCHLYDEEREDFRVRVDISLHNPAQPWPPIDPGGWVTARDYNSRDLEAMLGGFLLEREKSLAWLASLDNPDWTSTSQAPWGPMQAGDLFAAWVAHDLLHLRQLVALHYAYTAEAVRPFGVRYAGEW